MTLRVPADLPVLEERPRRGEALEGHDRPAPAGGGTVAPAESLRAPPSPRPWGRTGVGRRWRVGDGWTDGRSAPVPIPSAGQVSCECFQPPSPGPRRPPLQCHPTFWEAAGARGGPASPPFSPVRPLPASPQRRSHTRPARGHPRPPPHPIPTPPAPGAPKGSEAMPQFVSQSGHIWRCLQRGLLLYLPPGTSPVLLMPPRPPRGGTQGCCTLAVSSRGGPGPTQAPSGGGPA